jgi:hypothetical protein
MKSTKGILHTNKNKYKVKNWKEYNNALIQRGSLTLWIDEDIASWWYGEGIYTYSDKAIEIVLTLKAIHKLPLRGIIGFIESVFKLAQIELTVPDYTTISRRAKHLNLNIQHNTTTKKDLILDSTGLKVYGEGEWKVRKHGWSYRRTWKKVHIGISSDGLIQAVDITHSDAHDCKSTTNILSQVKTKITNFYGDGAYDVLSIYKALQKLGVTGFHIPPQVNAKIRIHGNSKGSPHPRDENLRAIRNTTRKRWKQESGYHTRSLGETVVFRFKTTFGQHLSFRNDRSQKNEVLVKCNTLNVFRNLCIPQSYVVKKE